MTELRECPFCGGAHHNTMGGANVEKLWWIKCQSCNAEGPTETTEAAAISAWNRRADDWQPIETAPEDRPVEVYAPPPDPAKWVVAVCDMPEIMCIAKWHPDAGFCVCTIREVTHWREVRRPLPKGPGG